jgi:hypothetical protein
VVAAADKPSLLASLSERVFSEDNCFYCGETLHRRTREHVFPLWVQRRFGLTNQTITLLNGTRIKYSNLTVPCCHTCNTVHLSQLEKKVKEYLFDSPIAVARRHAGDILTWTLKILLGIIYSERLLPANRRNPSDGPILPTELWDAFTITHLLIQGLRIPIHFTAEGKRRIPGSIAIFNIDESDEDPAPFDFRDEVRLLSVFIRLGSRGILASADGGAVDIDFGAQLRSEAPRKLHPVQFREFGATWFYKSSLLNRRPKYLMFEHQEVPGVNVMQLPLAGLSDKPVFDEWHHPDYAQFLSFFTGFPLEIIAPGDRSRVMQWRRDQDGKRIPLATLRRSFGY